MPVAEYRQVPRTNVGTWEHICRLREGLIDLKGALAALRSSNNISTRSSTARARDTMDRAELSLSALEEVHQALQDHVPPPMRRTAVSAVKAQKVFDVAELLEHILWECEFRDLLAARQVTRTFSRAFQTSTRLQYRLGQQAESSCSPYSPLSNSFFISRGCIVRFEYRCSRKHGFTNDEIALLASFNDMNPFEEDNLPRVGERLRCMLICQPPVLRMRVRTDCCDNPLDRRRRVAAQSDMMQANDPSAEPETELEQFSTIQSGEGITLGHVLDETRRLRREHRYCSNALLGLHRQDGTVSVGVHFEAALNLSSEDPWLMEKRQEQDAARRKLQERKAREARMQAYIAAKQSARNNGQSIPTFEQFEHAAALETLGTSSSRPS